MSFSFSLIAAVTAAAAVAAVGMRNLVHCVLALTLAFAGLAAAYLQLGAQFVGFVQILVYVGAVAILIVFAILLTRGSESANTPMLSKGWISGVLIAVLVLGVLIYALASSSALPRGIPPAPDIAVRQVGDALMRRFVLPLEIVGLLLTAALIGGVIIAMQEPKKPAASPEQGRAQRGPTDPTTHSHP
ncbi:MAG TPA: NADH-quinone oxidoreductase subunit J [Verrucomicrobiae bacterium]|nr:NADH-quinone oxidoreductase subunit J [Verrucomicrobiae bacterium]